MQLSHEKIETPIAPQAIEKLYIENTLLRVAGALFCHDRREAGKRISTIETNRVVAEKRIAIRPDPEFGQPGPLAHKIFVALIKKHSDYGRPVPGEVSFTKRELMRLVGRESWGGSDGDELVRALNEIHHTFVRTSFKNRDGKFAEHSFAIFPEIYLERTERESDPIESCVVTLARPIVASLEDDHFTCLNHAMMQQLGTIGQALMMRLFFHFANLYDGHHKSRLAFPKRYDAICAEWLGGLKVLPHRSMIERDQLGPHLRALVREDFLASYAIVKARSGDGFVITFRPGSAFFADYDRFYRPRPQGGLQFSFHGERQDIVEPLKLVYLFQEKRDGKPLAGAPYASSREVEHAREILKVVSFADAPAFIDHALREAARTRFQVQSLGGLRQYLSGFVAVKEAKAANGRRRLAQVDRERAEREHVAYAAFRREQALVLFSRLTADEKAELDVLASTRSPAGTRKSYLTELMRKLAIANLVAERYGNRITSFTAWQAERQRSR